MTGTLPSSRRTRWRGQEGIDEMAYPALAPEGEQLTATKEPNKLAPVTRADLEQREAWRELYAWLFSDTVPEEREQ